MLQEFGSEDVVSLAVSLSLLGSFVCFLKILIDANLQAWRNIWKDKDLAVTAGRDKKRRGGGGKVTRITEQELLGNAWFGWPCGILAMLIRRHKIRKWNFLLCYCSRALTGVCVTLVSLLLYLVPALPQIVGHWDSAKDLVFSGLQNLVLLHRRMKQSLYSV